MNTGKFSRQPSAAHEAMLRRRERAIERARNEAEIRYANEINEQTKCGRDEAYRVAANRIRQEGPR